jgi:hypothetical protein
VTGQDLVWSPRQIGKRALQALLLIVASGVISSVWSHAWHSLRRAVGATWGVVILTLAALSLSALWGILAGPLRAPTRRVRIRVGYTIRVGPFLLRDWATGFRVGDGLRNQAWPSEEIFESEDARRVGPTQRDFGVAWRDARRKGCRVTYIVKTGEVVAVAHSGGVELLGRFNHLSTVEARLNDYHYAAMGGWQLRWIRRRLAGWRVPIPPVGQWWKEEDAEPPRALPPPPRATVDEAVGTYIGAFVHDDDGGKVHIVIPGQPQRPLYHYLTSSPTGFAWGYGGQGPSDLAQSLLADRLGYLPAEPICAEFRDDIVAKLDGDEFVLTFEQVDAWIDHNRDLFADHPRARLPRTHE